MSDIHTYKNCTPVNPMPKDAQSEEGVEWIHHHVIPVSVMCDISGNYVECPNCGAKVSICLSNPLKTQEDWVKYRAAKKIKQEEMRKKGWRPYHE